MTGSTSRSPKFMNDLETLERYTLVSGYTIVDDEDAETPAGGGNGRPT